MCGFIFTSIRIVEGVKAEQEFEEHETIPDPSKEENLEMKEIKRILARELKKDPKDGIN